MLIAQSSLLDKHAIIYLSILLQVNNWVLSVLLLLIIIIVIMLLQPFLYILWYTQAYNYFGYISGSWYVCIFSFGRSWQILFSSLCELTCSLTVREILSYLAPPYTLVLLVFIILAILMDLQLNLTMDLIFIFLYD